ncbi:MAG: hypothetical protein M1812_007118 [Candelaria pacifica]|nr:MAG: hypothetical protein M1812_007118 [Candelaria pacifica]
MGFLTFDFVPRVLPKWKLVPSKGDQRTSSSLLDGSHEKEREPEFKRQVVTADDLHKIGSKQEILLLHGSKQKYTLTNDYEIPVVESKREMLIRVSVIGLNPIDWKAPAYGFGIPSLPCVSGRDFAGVVLKAPVADSRISIGDVVLGVSTDYRDYRKSSYQQYLVATDFNVCRLPKHMSAETGAPLGVAFVAATLALGVCLGVDFSLGESDAKGPNLLSLVRALPEDNVPEDIREECLRGINDDDRPKPGDWFAIWGASSVAGYIALQLAKIAGLRVICVADICKHGARLVDAKADVLVHRKDTESAVSIIREITRGKLRFGLDTAGAESAGLLQSAMKVPTDGSPAKAHLIGLAATPKDRLPGIAYHSVPIKIFHTSETVGAAIMTWMEKLLGTKTVAIPEVCVEKGGLNGVNDALDILKSGNFSGQRVVVSLKD